jgi:hypothetical protein
LPGVIPPHSSRILRVMWTSGRCLQGTEEIDQLVLTVRVGVFLRTEVIPLGEAWALSGDVASACP